MQQYLSKWGKRILLVGLLVGLMSACAASRGDVDMVVNYFDAINQGELETAQSFVCPERTDEITAGLLSVSTAERLSVQISDISCRAAGSDVDCRFTVTQEFDDGTQDSFARDVTFTFEEGQICGFEEAVAQ